MEIQEAPSKKRLLWSMAALVCALVGWFLFQLFGPNPPIIVSKETTVITSPLREDGLTDYEKHWRDLGRDGVTHENNGAVLFWQAIWPGDLAPEDQLPICNALGFERIPSSSGTLEQPYSQAARETIGVWLTKRYQEGLSQEESDALLNSDIQALIVNQSADEVIDGAMSRPWTSEQIPPLADWVARNEKPLDLLIEASQRPKWWSPSPSLLGDRYNGAIAVLLPVAQGVRGVARALSIRAMWNAGENRPHEAWVDLKACFRLARCCGKGITLVEQLVAIAIDGLALQQTVALLQYGEPNAEFARQVLNDLATLGMPSDVIKSLDQGERLCYADTVIMLSQQRLAIGDVSGLGTGEIIDKLAMAQIDWNFLLRAGNQWFDRLIALLKLRNRNEREVALDKYDENISGVGSSVRNPMRLVGSVLSRRVRTEMLSDVLLSLMLPAVDAAYNAEERAQTMRDLVLVAAALTVYRAEQEEYPEKLEQLAPSILAKVPHDLYSGNPFIYERKPDGGYLLYSVFENGTDDDANSYDGEIVGGEWLAEPDEDFDYDQTDLVIRVPLPKFALPALPKLEE